MFSEVIDLRLQSVELFLGRIVSGPRTGTHLKPVRAFQDVRRAAVVALLRMSRGGAPEGGAVVLDVAQRPAAMLVARPVGCVPC